VKVPLATLAPFPLLLLEKPSNLTGTTGAGEQPNSPPSPSSAANFVVTGHKSFR